MRSAIILIICTFLLIIPMAASAQRITLDTMQIDIWPEYDRLDVLIINKFTLADSINLPVKMTLRIPASSGGPFNLAYEGINEDGENGLYNLEYETQENGYWLEISFSAPTTSIQLEYYDPRILRDGDKRKFTFIWPADYLVQSMSIQVRQPVNAADMQFEPDLGAAEVFDNDQIYYSALFGQVEAGEQFDIRLSYSKSDDILSEGYDQIYAADEGGTVLQTTLGNSLPWFLGVLGLVLITVAVLWYLVPNKNVTHQKRHPAANREKQVDGAALYCHNCGTRMNAEDQFCRSCGTKLRK